MNRKEFDDIIDAIIEEGLGGATFDGKNIEYSWLKKGVDGGNCWSDGGHYSLDPESEPEFKILDALLMQVAPKILYLDVTELKKLITTEEREENDYYGNYRVFGVKILSIDTLWNFLLEKKLITLDHPTVKQ